MYSLADAILQENSQYIQQAIRYGEAVNELDEYGFTPLIEACIIENKEIAEFLLKQGADPNFQDGVGGTPLQWAAENNNLELCQLLITYGANPNSYNFSGQPILVTPMLRQHTALKQYLIKSGAMQSFAQDYINAKLIGHLFELVGTTNIIGPKNEFVEVDFEGFILEITLGLISDSVAQFSNHFAARQLRKFAGIMQLIINVMQNALRLIKLQQYRIDIRKHKHTIQQLLNQDPLLIPVGYEGHAITFIRFGNIWVKCDRREDSRLYDNIVFYQIQNPAVVNENFFRKLLYQKQSHDFINHEIDALLQLKPLTELKVDAQISGNCSWANVEAVIPALFFLNLLQANPDGAAIPQYKNLALNFFHRWRNWNMTRILQFSIQRYYEGDLLHKASQAEMLAAILFQRQSHPEMMNAEHARMILDTLLKSPYEYILKNYLQIYYYKNPTEEGKRFFDFLKDHGFQP